MLRARLERDRCLICLSWENKLEVDCWLHRTESWKVGSDLSPISWAQPAELGEIQEKEAKYGTKVVFH